MPHKQREEGQTMKCKNCGNRFPKGNFCPNCGKPVANQNTREFRKYKKIATTMIAFFTFAIVFGFVVVRLSLSSGQNISVTEINMNEYDMVLSADRTNLNVDETGVIILTVHTPDAKQVDIYDSDEKCIATLNSENVDDDGNWVAEVDISTEKAGVISLTACSDHGRSLPLNIYITAPITSDMMQECEDVLAEMDAYLIQQGYKNKDYDEDALVLAEEWLKSDQRVAAVSRQDTMTLFATNNHVAGACMLPASDNTFGSETNETYQPDSEIVSVYTFWKDNNNINNCYLYSRNVTTSNDVLVLSPLYSADYNCSRSTDTYEKFLAKKGTEYTNGGKINIAKDGEALAYIFSENPTSISNYGLIIANQHGSYFSRDDGSRIWTPKLWSVNAALYEAILEEESIRVGEAEIVNSMFYCSYQYNWAEKTGDLDLDSVRLFMSSTGIWGTSNFIMNKWQNVMFNNSFLYFGVCYSFCDDILNAFFVSHGAAGIAGYTGPINCDVETGRFKSFFTDLTSMVKEENRYKSVKEAAESNYGIENIWSKGVEIFYGDQMLHIMTNRDAFAMYGYGALSGTIIIPDMENDMDESISVLGTEVTLYRYINNVFRKVGITKVSEDGKFTFDSLIYGVYAVTAEKTHFKTSVTGIIFESQNQDGGTIELKPESAIISGVVMDSSTNERVSGADVVCKGNDTLMSVSTDDSGFFTFENISEGTYSIYAEASGYFSSDEYTLSVDEDVWHVMLDDIQIMPISTVTGFVKDSETMEALEDVAVVCKSSSSEIEVTTDAYGQFAISPLKAGLCELTVSKAGYADETINISIGTNEIFITGDILMERKVIEIAKISMGATHSAAITSNGDLYLWGDNMFGALGDGSKKDSSIPVRIMSDVKEVSLGEHRSAAITNDGILYEWGRGCIGNGEGDDVYYSKPVKIMENVKAVALGGAQSAAITESGELYLWGSANWGLGNGEKSGSKIPVKVMDNVKAVSIGDGFYAAITEDGDLYTWGKGALGTGSVMPEYTPVKVMENISTVSLGVTHGAAVTKSGDLYLWGQNYGGELGLTRDEVGTYNYSPVKVMSNIVAVSLGYKHSAALTENGTVYTWGDNDMGDLGNGTRGECFTPTIVMENVKIVDLGWYHFAAITEDGELHTWGWGNNGQIGRSSGDKNTTILFPE